ncbi:HAD-IB family hydrolase [Candidatus Parcubacteria bacterium]|nr:HAD-IB family hydrolase [Candidatus Parcubacteria bacterium]
MKKVAIFDIDGTLFRSSLLIELVDILVERGAFPQDAPKAYAKDKERWQNRQGSYENYINKTVKVFMENIKGVSYEDFSSATEIVSKRYKHRLYRYTRALLKRLKKQGYFLLAISQSPKGVLDPFGKALGFDKIYGRLYELGPSERFTGVITDLHLISNKANIVKRAIQKEGLTLEGSIGVGDTDGDISFLEMVETPICFNPNKGLYKHARRNGWKVVVERKDVIYEIPTGKKG